MELKQYQRDCLDVLREFFIAARELPTLEEAYLKVTQEADIARRLEIAQRLGRLGGRYDNAKTPGIPRVCLKVPTGGGKTILAAHSVRLAAETLQEKDYPFVIWFVPSEAIRSQTAEALKNTRHPYRMTLDEQFNGRVRIFELDEKFNLRPDDIRNNACIMVATIQAFRQSATDKYNVYKDNEHLHDSFGDFPKQDGLMLDEKGKPLSSFANLLYLLRPLMIVDEAHNVITDLSSDMQRRINPSVVLEFTATPQPANNTLYLVRAMELKNAEMIKLPIVLKEHTNWELAVTDALARRAELEKEVGGEDEYIRPVILFQAQEKDEEITVAKLKQHLLDVHGIPENEIAVATGDQKELDGINVFAKNCPIRHIITVQALKEGWDCSFAYVLCSVANVKSNTAIEQLLGRVMRMPYAKKRKSPALNKAYAVVLSKEFGRAANDIVEKLRKKGFEDEEARAMIQQVPNDELLMQAEQDRVNVYQAFDERALPSSFWANKEKSGTYAIGFTPQATEADVENAIEVSGMPAHTATELRLKYAYAVRTARDLPPPPCKRLEMTMPRMNVYVQGALCLAEMDAIMDAAGVWDFNAFVEPKIEPAEFIYDSDGRTSNIDVQQSGLKLSYDVNQPTLFTVGDAHWTKDHLIFDLCRLLQQPDVKHAVLLEWVGTVVNYLMDERSVTLRQLMMAKFSLRNKLQGRIIAGRDRFRKTTYERTFFSDTARIEMDFENGFRFAEEMYDDQFMFYRGRYTFDKHYLGKDNMPLFDGAIDGEETQCAWAINGLEEVDYWIRNIAKHPRSYSLPTAKDNFYPDFVCKLKDGRMVIVEYKGEHLRKDAEGDNRIGKAMEKASGGTCLFLMVFKKENGMDMRTQLKRKIGSVL
ncbi:MAG: DEAD/DEAH box helicase family protein [bacterium]